MKKIVITVLLMCAIGSAHADERVELREVTNETAVYLPNVDRMLSQESVEGSVISGAVVKYNLFESEVLVGGPDDGALKSGLILTLKEKQSTGSRVYDLGTFESKVKSLSIRTFAYDDVLDISFKDGSNISLRADRTSLKVN